MAREISLFADFHQKENSLTNYCGLILKLLYKDNPESFEEVLVGLLPSDAQLEVGPLFMQQSRKEQSIPDLIIQQRGFNLFIETKIDDWFYSDQLRRHIKAFRANGQLNVLFALSNFEGDDFSSRFAEDVQVAKKEGVILKAITFEELYEALSKARSSNAFQDTLAEFANYLDRNDLLPKWKYLLDVVNCFSTMNEIARGAYICPDTGGAYSHRRARYLGAYKDKQVASIFEIRAVVGLDAGMKTGKIKRNNSSEEEEALIAEALQILPHSEPWRLESAKTTPHQVFLLGPPNPTKFIKDSSGGMVQSKIYFWDIAKKMEATDAASLARKLQNRTWSEFGR